MRAARGGGGSGSGKCLLLAGLLLAAGCAHGSPRPEEDDSRWETFGISKEGRPIRGTVLGSGTDTALCFGVIHGNEPLGAPLLEELRRHLERHPELLEGRRVVIVPVLNPDGLARRTRTNAAGVDLNRNFPANNWSEHPRHGEWPASEPETRALLKILRQLRPSRILAVHSPLHCVNYDGPAEGLARDFADACGYPVRESIGYATPGSLGSYAGEDQGIPTITLELAHDANPSTLWRKMSGALERFVTADADVGN